MSAAELIAFHRELSEQTCYLGRRDIVRNVVWKKIENLNRAFVASPKAAAEYDAACAAYNTALEHGARAVELESPRLEVAELTLVAKISEDCWLMPWLWKEPRQYTPTLADMKLNCRLVAPTQAPFDQDFAVALQNVQRLMDTGATVGYAEQGIFDPKENPSKSSIGVRHVVFEPKNREERDDNNAARLREWPVKSAAARAALTEMIAKDSHRVHLLPAYDVDGDLIAPADCVPHLAGAVVRADISLTRWSIESGRRDAYVAEIERFRVIIPPPVQPQAVPSTPRKRKALAATDDGPSPSKRVHI